MRTFTSLQSLFHYKAFSKTLLGNNVVGPLKMDKTILRSWLKYATDIGKIVNTKFQIILYVIGYVLMDLLFKHYYVSSVRFIYNYKQSQIRKGYIIIY